MKKSNIQSTRANQTNVNEKKKKRRNLGTESYRAESDRSGK